MGGLPGWVDPVHIERHVEASAIGLWHVATGSELRLVTGPERALALQRHAADLASLGGAAAHDFLIARAPVRGPDRASRVWAMARRMVTSDSFRGIEDTTSSDGERWLHTCAYGDGSAGSVNTEKWIQAGHLHHMTGQTRTWTYTWNAEDRLASYARTDSTCPPA